jgi:uncharacterized protein DUF3303
MLFMVVEQFRDGARPVYDRADAQGRMLPDGLRYVDSWVAASLDRCFQLMECDDLNLMSAWIARWSDLAAFEVVPVLHSAEAAALMREARGPHPGLMPDERGAHPGLMPDERGAHPG